MVLTEPAEVQGVNAAMLFDGVPQLCALLPGVEFCSDCDGGESYHRMPGCGAMDSFTPQPEPWGPQAAPFASWGGS